MAATECVIKFSVFDVVKSVGEWKIYKSVEKVLVVSHGRE